MRSITFPFLWLLVFIMPWEDMFTIPGLASFARIVGLIAFLLGLVTVLVSGRWKSPLALLCVALFSGWCAYSTRWAPAPEMAMQRAQTYLLLLTFVWLICKLADSPRALKWLLRAFILGTLLLIISLYLGYAHTSSGQEELRFSAEAADENAVAALCSLSILFSFYLITRREKGGFELPNWIYWGYIIAAVPASLLTGSRAGALSLGITAFVLLGRFLKVTWKARLGLVVSLLLVVVLATRLVGRATYARIAEGTSGDTYSVRVTAWQYGLQAWTQTPLFGVGAGGYQMTVERMGYRRMVAHNTAVSVLVESGLIGFTIYFLFWASVVRRAFLLPKGERYFWFGMLAAYLPSLLSGSEEYSKLFWFLGALVLCQGTSGKAGAASRRAPLPTTRAAPLAAWRRLPPPTGVDNILRPAENDIGPKEPRGP